MKCILILGLFSCISVVRSQDIRVHDPVMIKQDGVYYLFCTGRGISVWSSKNMVDWTNEKQVFDIAPKWAVEDVPTFKNHIWAPDISHYKGKYYLFYSVSAFGKNTSCIGLAVNTTLDPKSPKYKWDDVGKIVQSVPGRDMWNAIDPNLIIDDQGIPWLTFGSFWNGIKQVRLKDDLTGISEPLVWNTVAGGKRSPEFADSVAGDNAIEAPFIFKKGKYYYLFVSKDYCCRGVNSTYKIIVGRSEHVPGPYVDRNGKRMISGGGSLVLEGDKDWNGVGHNAVCTFGNQDYLIFHGYDAKDNGKPKLRIKKLSWDEDWPVVGEGIVNDK